ncbi:MAG: M3 family metallopeptidase [Bacteroidales bacterium]
MKTCLKLISIILMCMNVSLFTSTLEAQNVREQKENPFLISWEQQAYNVPPFNLIAETDYLPAIEAGIEQQTKELQNIIDNREEPTFENTIMALERSGSILDKVAGVLFNIYEANSTPTLRTLFPKALQLYSEHHDNIYMNPFLFRRVKRLQEQTSRLNLNPIQRRLLSETYKNFVRNGAELPEEKQSRLRQINSRLSELENLFSQNMLLETNEYQLLVTEEKDLGNLAEDYKHTAAKKAEANGKSGWLFGLDNPSIMPFLQYASNADLRKEILDAYLNRCNQGGPHDNNEVVKEILNLRLEKAQIMGKPNYAAFVLEDRMAKTPRAVYSLLEKIWPYGLKKAKEESTQMQNYCQKQGEKIEEIQASDWRYYANLVKNELYSMEESQIREYFPLDKVKDGIFYLANRLYGLNFTQTQDVAMPTPNTTAYICSDKDGSVLGLLFLDMNPRPGAKSGGAWNTNYVSQSFKDGKRITPVTSIVCNFSPATEEKPSLLTIDETETFFHEFGHALHGLLSQVKYKGLQEVPRDFVELPSQIMEHWAMAPQMLKQYAKHYKTGESIPDSLINKIDASNKYGQGFATTEFLAAALLDMDYHILEKIPSNINLNKFEAKTLKKRHLLSQIPPRYRTNYFAHTMAGGYTAGYYGYSWAEVLDADAFEAFQESGDIFNPKIALSFRKYILENGGMYDAMAMYKLFRGREPEVKPLLKNRGLLDEKDQ